jgi:putative NADH-flavin reductase
VEIAVFGAAGRTGGSVVAQALARGHHVTAFVRDASQVVPPDGVTVVEGDARDHEAVVRALRGREAVLSTLALMSPQREPELSEATRAVIEAMKGSGATRIVVTANNDVFTDAEVTGEFAAHAREHRRNRDALRSSGLDWTIGAAPWVTDDPPGGSYEAVVDAKAPGRRLPAGDFATFVLDALDHDEWIGHLVGVATPA